MESEPSTKSAFLKLFAVTWGAIALVSAILAYGTHGPAHHPKLGILIIVMTPALFPSLLMEKKQHKGMLFLQLGLLASYLIAATALNNRIGESLPPWTAIAVAIVFGGIGIAISSQVSDQVQAEES